MSAKILRLGLQFFADGANEKENVWKPSLVDTYEAMTAPITAGNVTIGASSSTSGAAPLTVPTYTPPAAPTKDDYDTWAEKNGVVGEQGFYDMNGLDPDRDYQDRVNTLNYEYQTSLANYGQNAERLYQMGLSNSGVSDIFGANAFSAYLSNMNTAASERIAARKQNKAQYQAYVQGKKGEWQQYADAFDADRQTKINTALQAALESWDGYNQDHVVKELGVLGYDQGILDEVTSRLGALDSAKKKGATAMSIADMIFTTILPNYSGSEDDKKTVSSILGDTVDAAALRDAFDMADTRAGVIKNSGNTIEKAWNSIKGSLYVTSSDDYIKLMLKQAGFEPTEELVSAMRNNLDETITITEQEEQNVLNDTVEEEINKVEKNLETQETNTGSLTYEDYSNAMSMVDGIETQYGETDASKEKKEGYRQQNLNTINGYLDGSGDLNEAYNYLGSEKLGGVDESTWNDMNEQDKRRAIIDWAKGKVGDGEILPDEFYGMVSKYVTNNVTGTGGIIATDNGNAKASGLADAGELVTYIKGLGLNKDKQNELIGQVVEEMGFEISGGQINWYGTVNGAEASIYWGMGTPGEEIKITDSDYDKWDYDIAEKIYNDTGNRLISLNGNLYYKESTYDTWRRIKPGDFNIVGDGHTNTPEQAEGIYEILVVMLSSYDPTESGATVGGGPANNSNGGLTGGMAGKQQVVSNMLK